MSSSGDDRDEPSPWVRAGVVGALGTEFVGMMLGAYFLGAWLDRTFESEPWATLGCFAAAMIAAGWHVVFIARKYMADDDS